MTRLVGRTYLERGEPVVVLAQWRGAHLPPAEMTGDLEVRVLPLSGRRGRFAPRNVLIRRRGGNLVVRPFRGLRVPR